MENTIKRVTKRMNITAMLADEHVKANSNWVAYLENELMLLDKKTGSEKKPTKTQQANENVKELLLAVMDDTPATVSELQKRDETLAALSNQKVSAILRLMIADGTVRKVEEKGKSFFTIA